MSNKNKYNRTVSPDEVESTVTEQETTPITTEETTVTEQPVQEPVVETPVVEETPAPKATPTTATVAPKSIPVKDNPNARKLAEFEKLLEGYKKAVSVANPSESVRTKFVQEFMKLVQYVLNSNSYPVYNRFLTFFIEERNATMRNTTALCGIHKLRDARKREQTSVVYTVFHALARAIANQQPFRLSVKAIRMEITNETFMNWLINKLNR